MKLMALSADFAWAFMLCKRLTMCDACVQMERRARLRKIMATMDDEDERKAALPGHFALQSILYIAVSLLLACKFLLADVWPCVGLSNQG